MAFPVSLLQPRSSPALFCALLAGCLLASPVDSAARATSTDRDKATTRSGTSQATKPAGVRKSARPAANRPTAAGAATPRLAAASASRLPAAAAVAAAGPAESMLNEVFDDIGNQRFDAALQRVDRLLQAHPNFRLAHLIKGDLLLARAHALSDMGAAPKAPADRVQDLRAEALARLRAWRDKPDAGKLPRYLLQMPAEQEYALVVDITRARLYVYANEQGRPRFVTDYYISSGKLGAQKVREGDMKTPVGVYHVTSSLPAKKLPDFYGSGAFPINYPNAWDQRLGRDGHGIWLHGTPSNTYSRPPRASDGCVVLSNTDLDAVARHLQIGLTPVIISDQVEWVSPDAWNAERQDFLKQLEQWRTDWESLDTERYLQNYSRKFSAAGQDYTAFAVTKRQVNGGKQWVKVALNRVSAFRNPGRDDLVTVTFDQEYRSNNLSNVMKKRQYWSREGGRWRIVYEGPA